MAFRYRKSHRPYYVTALVLVVVIDFAVYFWTKPGPIYSVEPWGTYWSNIVVVLNGEEFDRQGDDLCTSAIEASIEVGWVDSSQVRLVGDPVRRSWSADQDPLVQPLKLSVGDDGVLINGSGHAAAYNDNYSGPVCRIRIGRFEELGFRLPGGGVNSGRFYADSVCRHSLALTFPEIEIGATQADCPESLNQSIGLLRLCAGVRNEASRCAAVTKAFRRWAPGVG